jgi:hypothetical protein
VLNQGDRMTPDVGASRKNTGKVVEKNEIYL